ncbi:MAG: transcriptional repressor [Chloroflexota bacterium]|nr:transcriptional repressor [Chloroflexota bacterium]
MKTPHAMSRALSGAGLRMTGPRRAVAQLLTERQGRFTAEELLAESRSRGLGIGRATIFRSLELLGRLNLLERIDLPSGEHAYLVCEPEHHHHVICSRCGRAETFAMEDRGLPERLEQVGRATGYRIDAHRLEVYGLCPDCLAKVHPTGGDA